MSENKLRNRDAIEAELKKTKAELTIAKHRETKLHNQIKGITEKERRHRNIVWGSHFEYLLGEKLNVSKEQLMPLIGTIRETWKNGGHCGQILKLIFIKRTAMR